MRESPCPILPRQPENGDRIAQRHGVEPKMTGKKLMKSFLMTFFYIKDQCLVQSSSYRFPQAEDTNGYEDPQSDIMQRKRV